mmetsp:Transcript_5511/g.7277  ORF Transcript_5511/g.7277 Transcript_5511/m.7277 type:complete len:456 (+) Transcript_5511:1827-3194(+)
MKVAFIHPDLGIGGAERLVVNAALSLHKRNHSVRIYTSHFDESRCFSELTSGNVLGPQKVRLHGSWIPRTVFNRFHVVCAVLRMCYAAFILFVHTFILGYLAPALLRPLRFHDTADYLERTFAVDIIFCDQVSHNIPILRLCRVPILFYCHYPDKLLCTDRGSVLKQLYRRPIDWFEEWTTGLADVVVVNSKFTKTVFEQSFSSLRSMSNQIGILYPAIELDQFDRKLSVKEHNIAEDMLPEDLRKALQEGKTGAKFILSINRFERKKNLALAIRALRQLHDLDDISFEVKPNLILAGGYDARLEENVQYMKELKNLTLELELSEHVFFVPSFTDDQRILLLQESASVIYTPDKEHFGIVPIEAMYASRPVVAVASGGPLESIQNEVTGFLVEQDPVLFAKALSSILTNEELSTRMGKAGKKHVADKFSLVAFSNQLEDLCFRMIDKTTSHAKQS